MSAPPHGAFAEAEHRRRVAVLQGELAAAGLDAVLLTGREDVFWVTGFLTRFWESPARPWFVLVPAAGEPVAVVPSIGGAAFGATWIADVRTWDSPRPDDEGVSLLAETIAESTPPRGRIGLPMGPETVLRMPLADHLRLAEAIAPRSFVDATGPLRRARELKSEAEIARIRTACAAAGAAFERVPETAGAGLAATEVARAFQAACLEAGADWVSYLACCAGPGGYRDVISPGDGRPLTPGDVLMLDTGSVSGGCFCDFDRNFAVGPPPDGVRRAHDALLEGAEAGIAAARPGVTAAEVHAAIAGRLRAAGFDPGPGRLGHGLGLALTEWPSLQPGDGTVLREGMVLAIEPGVALGPGRILVHEENIVLRAAGAERLSPPAPADLPVLA